MLVWAGINESKLLRKIPVTALTSLLMANYSFLSYTMNEYEVLLSEVPANVFRKVASVRIFLLPCFLHIKIHLNLLQGMFTSRKCVLLNIKFGVQETENFNPQNVF